MKIKQIELYQSPIKLKAPFIISLGRYDYANNIIVRMHTSSGLIGTGECSPFPSIHGEHFDSCFCVGKILAESLLDQNPLDIAACIERMDIVIFNNACIKSAFDMALYDLAAQFSNLPLYRFLGGKSGKTLVTDYTVSLKDPTLMAADALTIKQAGFQVIKVKLGGSKEEDIERIRLIREAVGNEIPIRIDANQGWSPTDAKEILDGLAPFNIQHCEEPIDRRLFMQLPEISKHSKIPIMADESCCDVFDAQRLLDIHACQLLNIKLSKSGGIFNALKIIQLAEKENIHLQLGGFLESRLGFTAAAHLALTSDNIQYYDFDTPLMFEEDPILGGIQYASSGVINLSEAKGLGAEMDESFLKKLKKVVLT